MSRRAPLTIATIPLFASDEEIGEVVLGFDRRRKFAAIARAEIRNGMPKFSETWGGWYVPAVLGFLEHQFGWKGDFAGGDRGVEGSFHGPPKRLKSSREIEAMRDDPNNRREFYRKGQVRVYLSDGASLIEDAKPTDPKSWQLDNPITDEERRRARGYTDEHGNFRSSARGVGKVNVEAPDGRTWIEDAKDTDPRFWHRKLKFKPKKKRSPSSDTPPAEDPPKG